MRVFIQAAKQRKEALDHVLLYGPPGLGKTTLSNIIANEMDVNIKTTSGPAIERPGDMAAVLNSLNEGDILFIDEIHRLNRMIEEILYPAMEDFVIDIMIGKGPGARSVRLDLPRFTLIGATTRIGLLTQSPGTTSSRSCRKLWTAWMVGRYTPAIRRMEEPEIPGSTMAVMATAPERKRARLNSVP